MKAPTDNAVASSPQADLQKPIYQKTDLQKLICKK
jgi:hypothetical protein